VNAKVHDAVERTPTARRRKADRLMIVDGDASISIELMLALCLCLLLLRWFDDGGGGRGGEHPPAICLLVEVNRVESSRTMHRFPAKHPPANSMPPTSRGNASGVESSE